jgi:hypothetical protein
MNELIQIVKDVGAPLAILFVLIRAIGRLGKFMAPMVEQLFRSHVGMVDALKNSAEKTQPLIESTHEMTKDIHVAVVEDGRPRPSLEETNQ